VLAARDKVGAMKRTKKPYEPLEETRKKMQPITRDRFTALLKKAARTQAKAFFKKLVP
jgi:hypothetical protein